MPAARLSSAASRQSGRRLFVEHCRLCHGARGDGRGARTLAPPAADFTSPAWRREASPRWVFFRIREGVAGTAMPSWRVLPEDECWDLTAYVLSLGGGGG